MTRALAVLFLVAIASACAPRASTPTAPEWQTVAELGRPRAFATAVALPDGKILVVGGLDHDDPDVTNRDAELIDPRTGTVTLLPQKLLGRLHQSITPAWGNLIVVAGGTEWYEDNWSPVDRVDVYHPVARKWVLAEPMLAARSDHGATALHDGRVIVTGGNAGARLLRTVEIYDVRTDRWTRAAPLPRARTQHTATTLIDGRVLLTGGIDEGRATDTTLIYDPRTDEWQDGPALTIPRLQHLVVSLPNGDVLLAGGDGPASGTSEVFDFETTRFIASGTLAVPRLVAQGAALPDGRVVVSGGLQPHTREFRPLRSAELWDPKTGQWTALPPAPTPRAWGTILAVGRSIYQVSGSGDGEAAYRTIERLAID